MFEMAWLGKGFTLNLAQVPDQILEQFSDWAQEKIKEEEEYIKNQTPPG